MSSIASRIAKLEKELNKLKVELEKENTSSSDKKKTKPKKIEDCTRKDQIEKFTVAELKEFIKKKKLDSKNASYKEDFVKVVLKYVKTLNKEEEEISSSDSSEEEDDEEEISDVEDDEWEYYYE